jgi:hypothetical protein
VVHPLKKHLMMMEFRTNDVRMPSYVVGLNGVTNTNGECKGLLYSADAINYGVKYVGKSGVMSSSGMSCLKAAVSKVDVNNAALENSDGWQPAMMISQFFQSLIGLHEFHELECTHLCMDYPLVICDWGCTDAVVIRTDSLVRVKDNLHRLKHKFEDVNLDSLLMQYQHRRSLDWLSVSRTVQSFAEASLPGWSSWEELEETIISRCNAVNFIAWFKMESGSIRLRQHWQVVDVKPKHSCQLTHDQYADYCQQVLLVWEPHEDSSDLRELWLQKAKDRAGSAYVHPATVDAEWILAAECWLRDSQVHARSVSRLCYSSFAIEEVSNYICCSCL